MRYKITLEYCGGAFCGWQRQTCALPSVQASLEEALRLFCQRAIEVHGSGRTDSGVHAMGQVAHFDIDHKLYNAFNIKRGLNFHLRQGSVPIVILEIEEVPSNFHARFSAVTRHYRYYVVNRDAPAVLEKDYAWHVGPQLNLARMEESAKFFLGHHDFTSFCDSECQSNKKDRTIDAFEITSGVGGKVIFSVSARSFLKQQVRIMVGTLVQIGFGRNFEIDKIIKQCNRSCAGITAPAQGLYFYKVDY